MSPNRVLQVDPIIHAPIRLAILSILISVESANFTFLKKATGATDGNLNTHLKKLEETGYITVQKMFKGKKPQTLCSISPRGRKAFQQYLDQMQQFLREQKGEA